MILSECRHLPHVGPTVLWNMIVEDSKLFAAWANSYDEETNQIKVKDACNTLAARSDDSWYKVYT